MMIDIQIFNFDAGSYLRMMPKKAPTKLEKNKKKKYLQAFLQCLRTFTPVVYSADVIIRAEALVAQSILAALLSFNIKQEYSKICGFVQASMLRAIVISNSLDWFQTTLHTRVLVKTTKLIKKAPILWCTLLHQYLELLKNLPLHQHTFKNAVGQCLNISNVNREK